MLRYAISITTLISLTATVASQVPDGSIIATTNAPQSPSLIQPRNGKNLPLNFPDNHGAIEAIACHEEGSDLYVGVTQKDGRPDILLAHLQGQVVTSIIYGLTSGLDGKIRGLSTMGGDSILACTTQNIYIVPTGGGHAQPLVSTPTPLGCLSMTSGKNTIAILAAPKQGQPSLSSLFLVDSRTSKVTEHKIGLANARAIAAAPAQDGYLVGDSKGEIYRIDQHRFTVKSWAKVPSGPITSMVYDPDQRCHWIGTPGRITLLEGAKLGRVIPMAKSGDVIHLHYKAHRSAFLTYGKACPGSNRQMPTLHGIGRPFPGNKAFAISLTNAPGKTSSTFMLGLDKSDIDLSPLGMPGCKLLTHPVLTLPCSTQFGRTLFPLPIPALPALSGNAVFFQWAIRDTAANRAGFTASNGGQAKF